MPRSASAPLAAGWFDSLANWLRPRRPQTVRRQRPLMVERLEMRAVLTGDWPVAFPDEFTMDEDQVLTLTPAHLIANDTDPENDSLSVLVLITPDFGTFTSDSDGTMTYTPHPDHHGDVCFMYSATDDTGSSLPAFVTITILPVADAPVAADDVFSLDEDGMLNLSPAHLLMNDTDVDGDALAVVLVDGPAHGTLTEGYNGEIFYTPAANFHGTDTFTYQASDGGLLDMATVTITVNSVVDPPVISNFGVRFENIWIFIEGLVTDDDEDPSGLTVHINGCLGSFTTTVETLDNFGYVLEYLESTHGQITAYVMDADGNQSETVTYEI